MNAAATARLVARERDPAASLDEQHDAFTQLVRRSQHVVVGLAMATLRDVDEANDVAQDAYAKAWQLLGQLRDPEAFEPWLKAIVRRECMRLKRRPSRPPETSVPAVTASVDPAPSNYRAVVVEALARLPDRERQVTSLFYFHGYSQREIARLLGLKPGTVGKRLYAARLRLRGMLPRSVRSDFVRLAPSPDFVNRVRQGLLDEYVGDYRFEDRPDHVVSIFRDGDSLISESGGQRHVLVSPRKHALVTTHYDGEGRFRRNRAGRITHFVYYEFGQRLGVAWRT